MKIKKEHLLFLKSTSTVFVTSFLIGLYSWMKGDNYIASFVLSVSIQYILFSFFGGMINNYFAQITRQKELDKLEQLSTILECAYCKKPNVMTFIPDENERIEFLCDSCNKRNLVNINFTVARITEPVVTQNGLTTPNLLAE
jgi:hypothetical protein